jgi:proline racemase
MMRSSRVFQTIETHTEGMATRVVTGGVGVLPGDTMAERREYLITHADDLRTLLTTEPRGHRAFSGAILQPPTRPDADIGVVFIEPTGSLPMCGHGTIGVATAVVETGIVTADEPLTVVRLDTPAGLVEARVEVSDGVARSVTLQNVPSFAVRLDDVIEVPGVGAVRYSLAYGGNFYVIVPIASVGLSFDRAGQDGILSVGLAIMRAVNEDPPVHPLHRSIRGVSHVQFTSPTSTAEHSQNAMVIHPGWFDRSPCGTGTSARMAELHARGELAIGATFTNESFIGTTFTGRLVGSTTVGAVDAVVPEISGRAWITGLAQHMLAPDDPFPAGFLF